jgi:hypothetical protein
MTNDDLTKRIAEIAEKLGYDIAESFYGFYNGDSTGSRTAMLYFGHNWKGLYGLNSTVERAKALVLPVIQKLAAELTADREKERERDQLRAELEETKAKLETARSWGQSKQENGDSLAYPWQILHLRTADVGRRRLVMEEQVEHLSNELDRLIDRFRDEYDISFAAVVGVLYAKAFLLCQEAQNRKDEIP